ncbi:MAG: hypothetical protein AB7P33_01065 [Dehalococcoidia bacterium]
MNEQQVTNLLYEALETELGGEKIYASAVKCAKNEDLKEEWEKYLEETKHHQEVLLKVFDALSLEANRETPGRKVVRTNAEALLTMMSMAQKEAPEAAEIVAAECVTLAETKDHLNWELIGRIGEHMKGPKGKALAEAYAEVEDQEDEHLYHTKGWTRELWIDSLGMPAVLPPPEEEKSVKTAIGAARAEQSREEML